MKIPIPRCSRAAANPCRLLGCLLGLLVASGPQALQADEKPGFGPVPWSQVSFQASRLGSRITVDMELREGPAAAEEARFVASPPGTAPFRAMGTDVLCLTVRTLLEPLAMEPIRLENQTWFDSRSGMPLARSRLRRGDDDFLKTYRFTQQGVFRIQRQPKTKSEIPLPAERWTKVNDDFYSYDLKALGCSALSEMSHLIWVVAGSDFAATGAPLTVCAFGKRQLHRVRIVPAGIKEIPIDYIEVRPDGSSTRRNATIQALNLTIGAEPIASSLKEPENFSVLGVQEDIVVFLDPVSRVPVQVSGGIPGFGHAALGVREVRLK
jgi:hypothetical protein